MLTLTAFCRIVCPSVERELVKERPEWSGRKGADAKHETITDAVSKKANASRSNCNYTPNPQPRYTYSYKYINNSYKYTINY